MAKGRSDQGKMTVEEAGRKGGAATAQAHGREFYKEIGRKGGEARRGKLGIEGYRELGRKGGAATSQKRLPERRETDQVTVGSSELPAAGPSSVMEPLPESQSPAQLGSMKEGDPLGPDADRPVSR